MTHTFKKSALTVALLSLLVGCNDDGTNGINGKDGINGTNGTDGINGTNGLNGSNGTNGLDATVALLSLLVGCNDDGINGSNGTNGLDASRNTISLSLVGRYESGQFAQSAAEIVSYDPSTKQAFVVNALSGEIDVLDVSAVSTPTKTGSLKLANDIKNALASVTDVSQLGAANSVSVHNGIVAVAVESNPKTNNGYVAFYQASDKSFLSAVEVGALPDMLTFTPDGKQVVVANEGEPNDGYNIDPEGSVSIINVSAGFSNLTQANVTQVMTLMWVQVVLLNCQARCVFLALTPAWLKI